MRFVHDNICENGGMAKWAHGGEGGQKGEGNVAKPRLTCLKCQHQSKFFAPEAANKEGSRSGCSKLSEQQKPNFKVLKVSVPYLNLEFHYISSSCLNNCAHTIQEHEIMLAGSNAT